MEQKDFSEIIRHALELGGFTQDVEPHEIIVGFGHHATLSYADKIVQAVESGKLRHFFPDPEDVTVPTGKKLLYGFCTACSKELYDPHSCLWKIPL